MKDIIHICAQHKVGVISNLRVVFMMRLPYRVLFSINLVVRSYFNWAFGIIFLHWPLVFPAKCFKQLSSANNNLKARHAIDAGNGAHAKCSWSPNLYNHTQ